MKDLNDEGEKMGEGNWNESDLWQREAEENGLQTEPELQNAVQSPKQIRKTCRREVRRVCNVLGWALAFFSVMTVLVSILLEVAGNVWALIFPADELNPIGKFQRAVLHFSKIADFQFFYFHLLYLPQSFFQPFLRAASSASRP